MAGNGGKAEREIVWSDGLSVGDAAMDEDHRRFIGLVGELNAAIAGGGDKPQVLRCLRRLVQDAKTHFAREQSLLHKGGYPGRGRHAAAHTKLLNEIVGMMAEVRGANDRAVWSSRGLRIWRLLLDHLRSEDFQYRDWLRSRAPRGVSRADS